MISNKLLIFIFRVYIVVDYRDKNLYLSFFSDTTIDPSLQDKQRQLKKARLADDLNDRLSHRPGPLELIKGNILQTDENFAQAVKGMCHFIVYSPLTALH